MKNFRGTTARLRASVASFSRDENGSATIWNLTWLLGFAIMLGLAVDTTNARRNQTMLQSTVDVAALAGVMDLPNPYDNIGYGESEAETAYGQVQFSALDYATRNMRWSEHGVYTDQSDIYIGHWDFETRTFTWGEDFLNASDIGDYVWDTDEDGDAYRKEVVANAVQVWGGKNTENNNWVQTNWLRLAGQSHWDVNVMATAAIGAPSCFERGFMAGDEICVRSNNTFDMQTCLYGHEGLNFRNGNTYVQSVEARTGSQYNDSIDDSNLPENQPNGQGLEVTGREDYEIPLVDQIYDMAAWMMLGHGFALNYNMAELNPSVETGTVDSLDEEENMWTVEVWDLQLGNTDLTIQDVYPAGEGPDADQTWWRGANDFDVAFAGPVSSLMSMMAASHSHNGNGGGGGGGGGGGLSSGCDQGASAVSRYTQAEIQAGQAKLGAAIAAGIFQDPVTGIDRIATTSGEVVPGKIFWYRGSKKITLSGYIHGLFLISNGPIDIASDATVAASTLISFDKIQAIHVGSNAVIGKSDGCLKGGGTMLMGVGTIEGASGVEFNGAVVATGGTAHFAAGATSYNGLATYAKGNVSFASNSQLTTYNKSCKSEVYIDDEHLIYRLVE